MWVLNNEYNEIWTKFMGYRTDWVYLFEHIYIYIWILDIFEKEEWFATFNNLSLCKSVTSDMTKVELKLNWWAGDQLEVKIIKNIYFI